MHEINYMRWIDEYGRGNMIVKGRDLSNPPKIERNLNMTSLSYIHSGHHFRNSSATSSWRGLAGRIASAWRHHRDELELESLPFDIRKDIGFPSADEEAEMTLDAGKSQ